MFSGFGANEKESGKVQDNNQQLCDSAQEAF